MFLWQSLECSWTRMDEEAALRKSSGAVCLCRLVTAASFILILSLDLKKKKNINCTKSTLQRYLL